MRTYHVMLVGENEVLPILAETSTSDGDVLSFSRGDEVVAEFRSNVVVGWWIAEEPKFLQ